MNANKDREFRFPALTSQEEVIVREILNDLLTKPVSVSFDKLKKGIVKLNEPISSKLIPAILEIMGRLKAEKSQESLQLITTFLRICFEHYGLDATRIFCNPKLPFETFKLLIELGAPVTAVLEGYSLVMILNVCTTTDHRSERCNLLVKAGVNVNQMAPLVGSELHLKIANEMQDKVIEWIDSVNNLSPLTLDFRLKDSEGKTALLLACKTRSLKVVTHILEQKIERDADVGINEPDLQGRTPLHMACILGCIDIAKLLIAHGADFSKKDQFGCVAKDYCEADHDVIVSTLQSIEIDPERDENAIWNSLIDSLSSYLPIKILGKTVPSIKSIALPLFSKVFAMDKSEEVQFVKRQVENFTGKSLYTVSGEGRVALKKYFQTCNEEAFRALREKSEAEGKQRRSDINKTLFQAAAYLGKVDEIKRLIPLVDINAVNANSGFSACHIACHKGHYGVILALCESDKLHSLQTTKEGKTAFQLFMTFHKHKSLSAKKRALYYAVHEKFSTVMFTEMQKKGLMRQGQIVRTDLDGNIFFYDSQQHAEAAAKEEAEKSKSHYTTSIK